MENLMMCRICLATDLRMESIVNTHLQDTYEKLTLKQFETKDSKPTLVCYLCCARLQNCYQLSMNCLQSEELLTQMLSGKMSHPTNLQEVTRSMRLGTTPVIVETFEDLLYDVDGQIKVDSSQSSGVETEVKMVVNEVVEHSIPAGRIKEEPWSYDSFQDEDTEDEIPLEIVKHELGSPRLCEMAFTRRKIMSALKANEKKTEKMTNESNIWRRYVDYKDLPSTLDHRNEYDNSYRYIKSFDTDFLKDKLSKFEKLNGIFDYSLCHELMCSPAHVHQEANKTELEDIDPLTNSDDDDNESDSLTVQDKISSSSSDSAYSTGRGDNVVAKLPDLESKTPDCRDQNQNNGKQTDTLRCGYVHCTLNVYSTCAKCLCFLCWDHFDDRTSYNNCQNHIPFCTDQTISKESEKVEELNQRCEYVECKNKTVTSCTKCSCRLCVNHFQMFTLNDSCVNHKSAYKNRPQLYKTNKGKISKRKIFAETLRENEMKQLKLERFAMKEPCNNTCKKKCAINISEARRQQLHDEYNNLDWESQGIFIKELVTVKPVKKRKKTPFEF